MKVVAENSADILAALRRDGTVDLSTLGRRSGQWRRIEIWFHHRHGNFYLASIPGFRHWYANLIDHPDCYIHLKQSLRADLRATATPISNPETRRRVLGSDAMAWYHRHSDSRQAFIDKGNLMALTLEIPA